MKKESNNELKAIFEQAFANLEERKASKDKYIKSVQIILINFIKEYNGLLSYNSDILARLVTYIAENEKQDLKKLGAFLLQNTTIKSVSIKKPSEFTTTEYLFKNGKKYKTVAFKEEVDVDNLPLWYDCKYEKKEAKKDDAKTLLQKIKAVLNTVDGIENNVEVLAIAESFYKTIDNASKKLEQIINNQ